MSILYHRWLELFAAFDETFEMWGHAAFVDFGKDFIESYPAHIAVFVRLDLKMIVFAGFEQETAIEVQVCADEFSLANMRWNREDFEAKDFIRYRTNTLDVGFFAGLAKSDLKQVALTVGMSARPHPYLFNIVKKHQSLGALGIDDPVGSRKMADWIVACENIGKSFHAI